MNDTVLYIAVSDIRPHCTNEPDVRQRLRKAMRQARKFWMSVDDTFLFKAAVTAALMETSAASEQENITRSFKALVGVSAAISGVPVDLEAVMETDGVETLPLLGLWYETADNE